MSRFTSYNTQKESRWVIDTTGYQYVKAVDLIEQNGTDYIYTGRGVFITKGHYGKQAVMIIDGMYVNMPKRFVETFEEWMADDEIVEEINNGELKFKLYNFHSKMYDKDGVGIEFID